MDQNQLSPQPGRPEGSSGERPRNPYEEAELKSARTLATVATIGGPVSLIIGGVALSTVAIVCGAIAFVKVRRILDVGSPSGKEAAAAIRASAIMGIAIGAFALILNGISLAMMLPMLMEAMQTGDYSAILGDAAGAIQGSSGSSSGTTSGGGAWG